MAEVPEGYVRACRIVPRSAWESPGFRDHFLAALESEPGLVLDQVVEHPQVDEVHIYVWASPEEIRRNPTLAACPSCGAAPLILAARETLQLVCAVCGTPPDARTTR